MSMYKFVKGARLFMQGKREDVDYGDGIMSGGPPNATGGRNGIHGKEDDFHGDVSDGELAAVHTYRNTTMEGTTSGERWSKSIKKGNVRHRSTRTVRKVTTITRGEQSVRSETVLNYSNENKDSYPHVNTNKQSLKFRVVEKEDLTAKEALLRWAQKTTHKYPGVKVQDFTQSWRDGLALNAIIHRNRPDLLDWRQVERRSVRERIELAFHIMEREYGVTRLLDPEDVDTPEPDEKSIITYVSQLYDVFPEPPPGHPLFDGEVQKKLKALQELASQLHQWIRENTTKMQDRNFPNSLSEMKRLAELSTRFRSEEIPLKHKVSFRGMVLKNDKGTLKSSGIRHKDTLKLEPMKINVRAPDGSTVDLVVDPEDTIQDIKDQVEKQLGIPTEDQLPVFRGSPLCDNSTLDENDICHGDVIDLQPMEIYVIDLDGQKWTYVVNPLDIIKNIKNRVEDDTGVKRKHQRLSFQGNPLEDEKIRLKDAGIKHKDTLKLEPMKIKVRTPDGHTFDLVVDPEDTIKNIKKQVQRKIGIPIEDQLPAFKDSPLHDTCTLDENNISHDDVIELQPMEIYVVDLDGQKWTYVVNPFDSIKTIKNWVEGDTGVNRKHQRLSFRGNLLEDEKSCLKDAGIKHKDTLKLQPMQIEVRAPDGRTVDLVVNPEDTIEDIKRQVQRRIGIPIEDQLPAFKESPLRDNSTLEENNIRHGDVIDLQSMEIYVIDLEGQNLTYVVNPSDSIKSIKNQVEDDTGVKMKHQRLSFRGNLLDDDKISLTNAGIRHKDTLKLELMQIEVRALDGRTVDLVVDPEDTIQDIKDLVEQQLGIPTDDQLPVFKDSPLCDNSTLEENNICHGDVIDLQQMKIYVMNSDRQRWTYAVNPSDTIESIKNRVEDDTGVKKNQQCLTFQCTVLKNDEMTLKNAGIKHLDTLKLEPFQIYIRLPMGKKITLEVKPETTTPTDLKEMVEEREGIAPKDQILHFKGTKLMDQRPLQDYSVKHGDTIDLRLPPAPAKTRKSYLPEDWKKQQSDLYGNITVTKYKVDYNGEPEDALIVGRSQEKSDFKLEKPVLKSQLSAE